MNRSLFRYLRQPSMVHGLSYFGILTILAKHRHRTGRLGEMAEDILARPPFMAPLPSRVKRLLEEAVLVLIEELPEEEYRRLPIKRR